MNYTGTGRSNYFSVVDPEQFKSYCDKCGIDYRENDGKFVLFGDDEAGYLPSEVLTEIDEDIEDYAQIDPLQDICNMLQEHSVLVWQQVGNEGQRYVSGESIAYCKGQEPLFISLNQIYDLIAKNNWPETDKAEY